MLIALRSAPCARGAAAGIAFAVHAGRAILADDVGLGKTIQGVGTAELLAREVGIRKVLVICPASVKSQWRSEIHRFSECVEEDGEGRQRLTITLANKGAIDNLAQTLAKLLVANNG